MSGCDLRYFICLRSGLFSAAGFLFVVNTGLHVMVFALSALPKSMLPSADLRMRRPVLDLKTPVELTTARLDVTDSNKTSFKDSGSARSELPSILDLPTPYPEVVREVKPTRQVICRDHLVLFRRFDGGRGGV